ncbi:MAG: hypothetical protein WC869_00480 [Phycisphaerae bacterium]|jgi:hypothetical protein
MTTLNFARDIRLFAPRLGENITDVVAQVASVERLPSMAVTPGLAEAKTHLMEVCHHLLGDITFQGQALELHAASVCCRALRIASAFAHEDLAAERSGRLQILSGNEWRTIHQAVMAGCAGQVPVLRRMGTLRPPKWALDLIELTGRLGEVGWGTDEVRLKHRVLSEPNSAERRAAAEHTQRMIARKAAHLGLHTDAVAEAKAWLVLNGEHVKAKPRPAGCLSIDGMVWIRMSPMYRTPAESAEVATERRQRELNAADQTVVCGGRTSKPFRAHREVLDCLADNRRKASEFARNAGGNRRLQLL